MTPTEYFQLHGIVSDPEEAASILEKEFAEISGSFGPAAYRVVWECYPRNIHPAMIVAWLRSKGWLAEIKKELRDGETVLFPVLLAGETYQDLFSGAFSAKKEHQ